MKKNELYMKENEIYRVLDFCGDNLLLIDCIRMNMPFFATERVLEGFSLIPEKELRKRADIREKTELSASEREIMHHRFSMIAGILPVIGVKPKRSARIEKDLIKPLDENTAPRYMSYIPSWA